MHKLLRALPFVFVLSLVVGGSTLGLGFACAGEVPGPYYYDVRPSRTDTYSPSFPDGLGRQDVTFWEDGTPTTDTLPGYIDGPVSGAAP